MDLERRLYYKSLMYAATEKDCNNTTAPVKIITKLPVPFDTENHTHIEPVKQTNTSMKIMHMLQTQKDQLQERLAFLTLHVNIHTMNIPARNI